MTSTTIKVSAELRDALKMQAGAHGRTLGQHLQYLLDQEARLDRFRSLEESMERHPADSSYTTALREWQSDAWN